MSEPVWVPLQAVVIIHDRQIARHGGASGMRDIQILEAAKERQLLVDTDIFSDEQRRVVLR